METPSDTHPHPARHLFGITGTVLATLIIIASFLFAAVYLRSLVESNQMAAVVSATLVELANNDRESEALEPLAINPVLVAAAKAKANDMAEKGYFAHVSPEGLDPWHWLQVAGYGYAHAGENLAVNFSDSENVEEAWMDSPTHRANILNGAFTEIGIATAVGEYKGKRTVFVVQMFGTPREGAVSTAAPTASVPEDPTEPALATAPEPEEILGSDADVAPPVPVLARTTPVDYFMSSPQALLRTIYIVLAIIVLIGIIMATRLELRRHHVRHMVAASFLLVLMAGLFTVADQLVFAKPTLTVAVGGTVDN